MAMLVVASPGLAGRRENFDRIEAALRKADPDLRWEYVDHGQGVVTFGAPDTKALDIVARVDRVWDESGGGFDRIVFVGYSAGAILVRLAYLIALGTYAERQGPGRRLRGQPARPWRHAVRGMALVAGINAGWKPPPIFTPFVWLADAAGFQRRLFSGNLIQGSAFVTNVRLDWMAALPRLADHAPRLVQILGTRDSIVDDSDSTDVLQFPRAERVLIEGADHKTIMERTDEVARHVARLTSEEAAPPVPSTAASRPSCVVFIVHGIRDSRESWPDDAEAEVRRLDKAAKVLRPGYGYLSALRFVLPGNRRKRARWFCDQYTRTRAEFPGVPFHFIGHSNGTYTLGRSLTEIHGMRFDRVVLMGSVLPREFPWSDIVRGGQAGAVENHRSRRDWPVAWLCSTLRALGMKDLGTGGFEGFDDGGAVEVRWYPGGHGSPMSRDEYLRRIAAFVCGVTPRSWDQPERLPGPGPVWLASPRWFPVAAMLAGLAVAAGCAWAMLTFDAAWIGVVLGAAIVGLLIVADFG